VERETWRQVCDKLGGDGTVPNGEARGQALRDTPNRPFFLGDASQGPSALGETSPGFSVDA